MIKLSLVAATELLRPKALAIPRNEYDAWYCPGYMGGVVLSLEHIDMICAEYGWTKSLDHVIGICTFGK